MCISDTWLNKNTSENHLCLDDYTLWRKNRTLEGGNNHCVALFTIKIIINLRKLKIKFDWSWTCEAKNDGSLIYNCVLCKPLENFPHICNAGSIANFLELIPQNRIAMQCGDLNLPSICWDTPNSKDECEQQVSNLFRNWFSQPAKFFSTTSKDLLDVSLHQKGRANASKDKDFNSFYESSDEFCVKISLDLLKIVSSQVFRKHWSFDSSDSNGIIPSRELELFQP